MILEAGEKVHVLLRRRFDDEPRRHFLGRVVETSESIARVEGYAFAFDSSRNELRRSPDRSVRLVSLVDAGNVVSVLPAEADLDSADFRTVEGGRTVFTDGTTFRLDVSEFGARR